MDVYYGFQDKCERPEACTEKRGTKRTKKTINIQHKISPDQNGDDLEDNNTTKKFLTVCKQCILLLTWQFQVKYQK